MIKKHVFSLFCLVIGGLLLLHAVSPAGLVSRLLPISPAIFACLMAVVAIGLYRIATVSTQLMNVFRKWIVPSVAGVAILARLVELLTYSNFVFTHTHLDPNALILLSFFALAVYVGTLGKKGLKDNPPYAIFMFGLLMLHIPFMRWYNYSFYNSLSGEDKLFEWIQFAIWEAGAGFFAVLTYSLVKVKKRTTLTTILALYSLFGALGYFLIAGEEVSWGQRILGFDTPKEYIEYNSQGEFNLHNNEKIFNKIYFIYGMIGLYALVSPLFYKGLKMKLKGISGVLLRLVTFRWYHGIYFIPTIIYVAYRVYYDTSAFDIWEESSEVLFATGMLMFAVHAWFVARRAVDVR